ncbi:MAG: cytochrome c [Pseudomonadota bacterium]
MRTCAAVLVGLGLVLAGCSDDRAVTRGAALYQDNCLICHGADLRGGGGAAVSGLSGTPPDLTVLAAQAGGVFPRAQVLDLLANYAAGAQPGRRMRPFSHLTSEDRSRVRTLEGRTRVPAPQAALLVYLESVQRSTLQIPSN